MRIENVVMFQVKNKLAWNEHAHFHPSGDAKPSKEDIIVTQNIINVGEIIGINVLDHIIIGNNEYCSLKEKYFMNED